MFAKPNDPANFSLQLQRSTDVTLLCYVFERHEIASITPGSGISTIVFKSAHNLTTNDSARIIIPPTDPYNGILQGRWTATKINATTITIPVVAVQAVSNSGTGGKCTDISAWTLTPRCIFPDGTTINPTPTITDGTYGEWKEVFTRTQTGDAPDAVATNELFALDGAGQQRKQWLGNLTFAGAKL